MKKSKIIVPALGILAFSTAAAVTGTVAWFTASRQATINASAITAYNPEAGLKVTLANRSGSTAVKDGANITAGKETGAAGVAAEVTHEYMRDGSVDVSNKKVYRGVAKEDGSQPTSFELVNEATNGLLAGQTTGGTKYYYATAYTATFALSNADLIGTKTFAIYYDNSKLVCTDVATKNAISPSFRMGFACPSSTNDFVLVPFRAAAPTAGLKYISGSTPGVTSYTGTALYGLTSETWAAASPAPAANLSSITGDTIASASKALPGYLGDINSTNQTLTVTVYSWFEGTDDTCINTSVADGNVITASLGFKMVEVI